MEHISLENYQTHGSGAGIGRSADVAELEKALEVGHLRGGDPSATSAGSLKVQSLENTLKILSWKESDMMCYQKIPKLPAHSTIEEYERLENYGSDAGGFSGEGELPEEQDSNYSRQSALVKYLGTTRSVSHQSTIVTTMVGNLIQREVKNGTLWLLKKGDRSITKGNSAIVTEEFDGLYKLQQDSFTTLDLWQDSDTVIDLKGDFLKEEHIESAADRIIENYGDGDLLLAPPKVLSNFVKQFHESKLIMPNTAGLTDATMGQRVRKFASQFGDIALGYDKFLKQSPARTLSSSATSTKAPAAPVKDAVTPKAAAVDTGNRFLAAYAGDYYYAVAAINKYGESALTALNTSKISIGATQSADLKFSAGVGAYAATGYVIYRSEKDPSGTMANTNMYPLFGVSLANLIAGYDGAATGVIRDRNRIISNTDSAFLIENSDQVYSMKQLLPLMKMDLALLAPAYRFMILWYFTVQLYAPKKMVRFINVGPYKAN